MADDFEAKIAGMAAAQAGGDPPAQEEAPAAQPRGEDGKFAPKGDDQPEQAKNFKALRKEIESIKGQVKAKDDYIQSLQDRENRLLDLLEKGRQPQGDEDVWSHLPKDDPDVKLLKEKMGPALDRYRREADSRVSALEKEIKALREKHVQDDSAAADAENYRRALRSFGRENGLDAEALDTVNSVIRDGKVGGQDFEDAFENAVVYLKGRGIDLKGGKAAKPTKEEPATVGGIMPGRAGSPPPSDDFRMTRDAYRKARAEGDYEGEKSAFDSYFRQIQERQAGQR